MSISAISSSASAYSTGTAQQSSAKQDFQQLSQALQSGDLSGAQTAYASLMQSLPAQTNGNQTNGNSTGSPGGQGTPFQQAIASIGSALQSGDLSGAQKAMQSLPQAKGAHHGHHHHGGGAKAANGSSSTTDSTAIAALSATSPTINLSV